MSAEVWGTAADTIWNAAGEPLTQSRFVDVPPNALAAVSEGFCPACAGVQLGGNPRCWCPSCKVFWHIRQERTTGER